MKTPFGLFGRRDPPPPGPAPQEAQRALSLLGPEDAFSVGLPGVAICGFLIGPDLSEANFRPNRVFIDFMHQFIASAGPSDSSLRSAARAQRDGYVYVIDLRTPEGPQGRVPPEDIVGGFKVEEGILVVGGYWANPAHKVYTKNGLVRLPPSLHSALIVALKKGEATS